jgi:cell division protein YceG involved in septum cleavage
MSQIIDFIRENLTMIILIVFVVLGLLLIINIKDIDLNPPKPESKLVQQVTVETFTNSNSTTSFTEDNTVLQPSDSFCKSYLGNSSELNVSCGLLTETNCSKTSCCVYNNKKCVAGDKQNGPTYK